MWSKVARARRQSCARVNVEACFVNSIMWSASFFLFVTVPVPVALVLGGAPSSSPGSALTAFFALDFVPVPVPVPVPSIGPFTHFPWTSSQARTASVVASGNDLPLASSLLMILLMRSDSFHMYSPAPATRLMRFTLFSPRRESRCGGVLSV